MTHIKEIVLSLVVLLGIGTLTGCATHAGHAANIDQAKNAERAVAQNGDGTKHAGRAKKDSSGDGQNPSAKTLYAMASAFGEEGKLSQAEALFLRLIEEHPDFLPAYSDLAGLLARQGRYDDAIQQLDKGIKIDPKNPALLNNMGVCSLFRHDYAAALDCFTKASEAAPDNNRYRANMALALGALGRYDDSLELYKKATTSEMAIHNVGVVKGMQWPEAPAVSTADTP